MRVNNDRYGVDLRRGGKPVPGAVSPVTRLAHAAVGSTHCSVRAYVPVSAHEHARTRNAPWISRRRHSCISRSKVTATDDHTSSSLSRSHPPPWRPQGAHLPRATAQLPFRSRRAQPPLSRGVRLRPSPQQRPTLLPQRSPARAWGSQRRFLLGRPLASRSCSSSLHLERRSHRARRCGPQQRCSGGSSRS
jgi:hypothetical protein